MVQLFKQHSGPYKRVVEFYQGGNEFTSTGVPKINHIDEGLAILEYLETETHTQEAWCLHPLLQGDKELLDYGWHSTRGVTGYAIVLAMEYRATANAFLCTPETDRYTQEDMPKIVLPEVKPMLIADKISNMRNLVKYNRGTSVTGNSLTTSRNGLSIWR